MTHEVWDVDNSRGATKTQTEQNSYTLLCLCKPKRAIFFRSRAHHLVASRESVAAKEGRHPSPAVQGQGESPPHPRPKTRPSRETPLRRLCSTVPPKQKKSYRKAIPRDKVGITNAVQAKDTSQHVEEWSTQARANPTGLRNKTTSRPPQPFSTSNYCGL